MFAASDKQPSTNSTVPALTTFATMATRGQPAWTGLFHATTEPYVFTGADDVIFYQGWLTAALGAMKAVDGVVVVNDLFNPDGTLALISRRYIDENPDALTNLP